MNNMESLPIDRITESRSFEERDAQFIKTIKMGYTDPMDIPNPPEGMDLYWARHTVYGDPSFSRVAELMERAWTMVPSYMYPSLNIFDPFKPERSNGHIERKGLILMQRPRHYGELELQMVNDYNYKILTEAPGIDGMDVTGMPRRVFGNDVNTLRRTESTDRNFQN